MDITPNFSSVTNGTIANPTTFNTNFALMKTWLESLATYIESFISDLAGDYMAVVSGGNITIGTGLTVTIDETVVWLSSEGRVTCSAATVNLAANSTNYVYANSSGEFEVSTTLANYTDKLIIGKVITGTSTVTTIQEYDNKIFTINEMVKERIAPLGLVAYPDGNVVNLSFCYRDPDETGVIS